MLKLQFTTRIWSYSSMLSLIPTKIHPKLMKQTTLKSNKCFKMFKLAWDCRIRAKVDSPSSLSCLFPNVVFAVSLRTLNFPHPKSWFFFNKNGPIFKLFRPLWLLELEWKILTMLDFTLIHVHLRQGHPKLLSWVSTLLHHLSLPLNLTFQSKKLIIQYYDNSKL